MASGMGRGGFQGLIVGMLFFGPLIAAFLLYYGPHDARPGGNTAYGQLLNPTPTLPAFRLQAASRLELDEDWLQRKWWLVYVAPEGCDSTCAADLANLRKIWMLVGAEQHRVGYALLTTGFSAAPDNIEGLVVGWPVGPGADSALELLAAEATEGWPLLVVDPHRNLVMGYPAGPTPQGVLNDLKRLLRLSRIG